MSIELDRPGRGVAAFMLSLSTLFALAWGSALDLLSSPKVIVEAGNALRMIIDTYAKENTTFSGIRQSISHGYPDPLRAFSKACHEELRMH